MPQDRPRKLIESTLPVAAMNAAGRAEKAVPRPGVPATMHIWWSRKPTGLARAVLFATIVDDPLDRPDLWPSETDRQAEHRRRLDLVADLARWDCPTEHLSEARRLVSEQCGGEPPRVIDPFCGGGVIPLEAVRLGLEAEAVDLNPVAALLTKGLVEIPQAVSGLGPVHPTRAARETPGGAAGLAGIAADVAAYGEQLLAEVRSRIGDCYPLVAQKPVRGAEPEIRPCTAVSYLWARTATCTNPACRGEVPLLSTWWLSKRKGHQWHLAPVPAAASGQGGPTERIDFEVRPGAPPPGLTDLKVGNGASFRCPLCQEVTDPVALRDQGSRDELGLRLAAVQTFADPERRRTGRSWVSADAVQARAAARADPSRADHEASSTPVDLTRTDLTLPLVSGNIGSFGFDTIEKLLTPRQRLLMVTLCDALRDLSPTIESEAREAGLSEDGGLPLREGGRGARAYAEAVTTYLALTISRMANRVSTMTVHNRANGSVEQSFIQPGYAFYGDFPEANPFSGSTGSFGNSLKHVVAAVAALPGGGSAEVTCGPAAQVLGPFDGTAPAKVQRGIVCTDPPFYDMFDYSALSNLFYTWLRRALRNVWPDETATPLAPDGQQIVSNPTRFDGDKAQAHAHFESGLREAFMALRSVQRDDFPLTLYYGYQQTERRANGRSSTAWEVLLGALIDAGFQIVSTWPLRTERPEGVKTGSNSLASSILLACRRRPATAERLSRERFIDELRTSLRQAVETLRADNITPVDLAQSAIGPGMVIYSSYDAVIENDGTPMSVRTALELVNHALDEVVADSDTALDEETRWAVTWFEDRGWTAGTREAAQRRARAYGTSLPRLVEGGLITVAPGEVRLRTADALAERRSTRPGSPATSWEALHKLCRRLADGGQTDAAELLATFDQATAGRVKTLAYRLFLICNRKRSTSEAVAFNNVIRVWPALTTHHEKISDEKSLVAHSAP